MKKEAVLCNQVKKKADVTSKKIDWWDEINTKQKEAIDKGLAQLKRGEGVPHKEVMKKYSKWLKK